LIDVGELSMLLGKAMFYSDVEVMGAIVLLEVSWLYYGRGGSKIDEVERESVWEYSMKVMVLCFFA